MPCNPDFRSIDLDIDNNDFVRIRVKASMGGGLPKFAVTRKHKTDEPKASTLLHDGAPKPYVVEWPGDGESVFVGKHNIGFRGLYETCTKYELIVTFHPGGRQQGIDVKRCVWDLEQSHPVPRSAFSIKVL